MNCEQGRVTIKKYDHFLFEKENSIAIVTLSRPDIHNTMTDNFGPELYEIMSIISNSKDYKVVVMKAEGKIFNGGGNINEFIENPPTAPQVKSIFTSISKAVREMYNMPQPIICAVDGVSAGGGCNLALSCDFVFASEKAKFMEAFVNVGLIPDTGGLYTLTKLVGPVRAKELCMTGRLVDAEEALKIGMIFKLVPSDKLYDEVMTFARLLASKPAFSLRMIKFVTNKLPDLTQDVYNEIEGDLMAIAMQTKDHKEGATAFLEKRKPNFKGEDL